MASLLNVLETQSKNYIENTPRNGNLRKIFMITNSTSAEGICGQNVSKIF